MTVLVFNDGAWKVATSSWSASAVKDEDVDVCYYWQPASGVSRVTLRMSMPDFLARLAEAGKILDLTDVATT